MRFSVAILILGLIAVPAFAASWQPIANAGAEKVEIDKGRILRTAEGKTTAWTRLQLGREASEGGARYDSIQTMNRYDCAARRFATIRRVYMLGDKAVRTDNVSSPKDTVIQAGTVDDLLLTEACKLRTVGEAQKVAEAAALAAGTAKPAPVVDAARTEVKPEAAKDAAPEAKPVSRPRFIDLPKIDKSKIESPNAAVKPDEAKATEKAPEKPVAKPAPKPAEKTVPMSPTTDRSAASRRELERQYATSGPKRTRPATQSEQPSPTPRLAGVEWGYEGDGGPANWAKLRPDYSTCTTGRRQSPIDIRDGIRVDLEPIAFDYKLSQFRILDTGRTIEVNVGEGSTMTIMGRSYRLMRFQFRRPGEERINGRTFDMGMQFVHVDDMGRVAIVAVMLEAGPENPLIQMLWNHLPLEVNQDVAPAVALDLKALLPENRAYYTYMGSLTMPPCTEDVLWMVMKQPMTISAEQIGIFSRLYRNNARPVQPSNNRLIKESR